MNRNSVILAATVGVLAVGTVSYVVTRKGQGDEVMYRTAVVEKRDLRRTVSATGTVQPYTVVDIKSRAGGEVVNLAVDVGTFVKQGDLIARIDPTDSQTAFDQAHADVESANARVSQAQQTMSLQQVTSETSVREAEAQVRAAESRLAQAKRQALAQPILTEAAIRQARATLESAKQQLAQIKGTTDPQARAQAQSALDSATANLQNAELNLKRQQQLVQKGFVAQAAVDTAQAQRDVVQAQVTAARTNAETVGVGQGASIAAAQARVREATESLNVAEANRVQIDLRRQDVTNAEAALAQAQASLATTRANRAQVGIRAADIQTARAQTARSGASLSNARIVLNSTTIRAPRSGVILQKYVEEGTIISSGQSFNSQGTSLVQIGDLSRVFVEASVDESDISQVKPGLPVKLALDALPDQELRGHVERTDPRGTTDQNVTTIKTRIQVEKPDPRLRPGLNAECEFIIAEKKDVLVIPARAVHNKDGKKTVQILVGGDDKDNANAKPQDREVTTGMEAGDSVEVLTGLKEGEKIVTGVIKPGDKGAPGGGGPGGRGGQGGAGGGGGRGGLGGGRGGF